MIELYKDFLFQTGDWSNLLFYIVQTIDLFFKL